MLQVANNLFDSYMGACEKSDNAEPLLVVTVCKKKRCISHEIFAILYLDKREQDLEDNQETRWSIRAALGLNKQPSTAVERFPKKWQNQTIVMLLDNGRRRKRNRNRVPPPLELMNIFECYDDAIHRKQGKRSSHKPPKHGIAQ